MKTKRVDFSKYAAEYLFFAAVAAPWEVSEEAFTAVCAMATDTATPAADRENCLAFMMLAMDAAVETDPRAASPRAVYKAAREAVKRRGGRVYPEAKINVDA